MAATLPPHLRDLPRIRDRGLLLDDLDPADERWENWYLKFQFVARSTDCNVLVAEDADGGHELELGEVRLAETRVAKREYGHAAIDEDLEFEKFDGMMASLFAFLDGAGRLHRWRDSSELADAVAEIAIETA